MELNGLSISGSAVRSLFPDEYIDRQRGFALIGTGLVVAELAIVAAGAAVSYRHRLNELNDRESTDLCINGTFAQRSHIAGVIVVLNACGEHLDRRHIGTDRSRSGKTGRIAEAFGVTWSGFCVFGNLIVTATDEDNGCKSYDKHNCYDSSKLFHILLLYNNYPYTFMGQCTFYLNIL